MVTLEAKNVVLARANLQEGRIEVLESLRGDLTAGATLSLPEIAFIASESRRQVWRENRPTRSHLDAERLVVFLRRGEDGRITLARSATLSLVALERGEVWASALPRSYSGFGLLGLTESELRARVAYVGSIADELAAASKLEDKKARARALAPLAVASFRQVRWRALQALRECGADAAPVLRMLVERHASDGLRAELLPLLGEASHDAYVNALDALLDEDTRYWRRIGRTLPEEWWTGAGISGAAESDDLKARIAQTRLLLDQAQRSQDARLGDAATRLRAVWRTEKRLAAAAEILCIAPDGCR